MKYKEQIYKQKAIRWAVFWCEHDNNDHSILVPLKIILVHVFFFFNFRLEKARQSSSRLLLKIVSSLRSHIVCPALYW